MSNPLPQAILMLKQEFAAYKKSGTAAQFKPSTMLHMEISRITRNLEMRRETGSITDAELGILKSIDYLWSEIGSFNARVEVESPATGHDAYNFKNSEFVKSESMSTPITPIVTDEIAQKIISDFEKQFQEKIINKLKPRA